MAQFTRYIKGKVYRQECKEFREHSKAYNLGKKLKKEGKITSFRTKKRGWTYTLWVK